MTKIEKRITFDEKVEQFAECAAGFGRWKIDTIAWTINWSAGIAGIFGRPLPSSGIVSLEDHIACYLPENRDTIRRTIAAAIEQGRYSQGHVFQQTGRVLRPNGEIRDVLIHGIAQWVARQKRLHINGVTVDVTDNATMARSVENNSELLRITLENIDQGLLLIDADNKVKIWNKKAIDLVGIPSHLLYENAPFEAILNHLVAIGEYARADPTSTKWSKSGAVEAQRTVYERRRPNGTVLEIRANPVAGGGVVRTFLDVTVRRNAELAAQEGQIRYRLLAENTTDVIIRTDASFTRQYISPSMIGLLGYEPHEMMGDRRLPVHPDDQAEYENFLANLISQAQSHAVKSVRYRHRLGHYIWGEISITSIGVHDGQPATGFVASIRDITNRKEAERLVAHQAMHDSLTELPNRVLFRDRLSHQIRVSRRDGTHFAVLACDLDQFKAVNDTLGHLAGDVLLCEVAKRITDVVRPCDVVARLGGDEFALVLSGVDPKGEAAVSAATRIIQAVSRPIDIEKATLVVGISIGIAVGSGATIEADQLFKQADIAMYRAKHAGRNTCRTFEVGMEAELFERVELERDLRFAVVHGGLDLAYQPIFSIPDGRMLGCEALLRWSRPGSERVSPAEFIPIAEDTGLIVPIGAWVLRQACQEAESWPDHLSVAVNVSGVQFRQPELGDMILNIIAETSLAPHRLEIEITESVLLQDVEATIATLRRLQAAGIRIALDDFGTGYSSLNYLRRFPFDKIKIDKAFVDDIDDPSTAAIVRAVAGLATRVGADVTAEGIETSEQLRHVGEAGCTQAQGYLLGRPIASSAVSELIRKETAADPCRA